MARKRRVLFPYLEPILSRRIGRSLFVIALFVMALLGTLALPIAAKESTAPVPSALVSQTPDQTAQQLYQAGRYQEAIALLQTQLQAQQAAGDRLQQAMLLSNLSLNYQKLGDWAAATQAIESALALLPTPQQPAEKSMRAQALDVRGSLASTRGEAEVAVDFWREAAALHQQTDNRDRAILSQMNQARALQQLGLNRPAVALLGSLQKTLADQPDSLTKASTLRTLGDALRVAADLPKAQAVLQQSLAIAQQLQAPEAIAAAQLSLGNVGLSQRNFYESQGDGKKTKAAVKRAIAAYEAADQESVPLLLRNQARLNQLNLLIDTPPELLPQKNPWPQVQKLYDQILADLDQLPPGRAGLDLRLGLGRSALRWQLKQPQKAPESGAIVQGLAKAVQQARDLQDPRDISLSLGFLGRVYEQAKQWTDAETLTQQALIKSQSIDAQDLVYRWQWQLGRIHRGQEQIEPALTTYQDTYTTLQVLRKDLVAIGADVQFSFRESVEPVYRELIDLLLQDPSQDHLKRARQVLESLQNADLQNFLQSACQDTKGQLDNIVDVKDQTAAVIYPIILKDRLEVILKLPGQENLYHPSPVRIERSQIVRELKTFRELLETTDRPTTTANLGKKVYDWLITPLQAQLDTTQIKTLIFALDGPLRNIPMAALYDGKQFLVERYAVGLVLGLEVREPTAIQRKDLKVLATSLTEAPLKFREQYARLDNANIELDQIKSSGLQNTLMRDEGFTKRAFNQALNDSNFQVIHLATHGQFGADRSNTYILAADGQINVDELDDLFRTQKQQRPNPIELLFLSACKTAAGNDRAVLGIAGTAVRAGAQSTIAGLWSLADASSVPFSKALYAHLGEANVSRAEALRLAQVALLNSEEYSSPRFWAPYVLVGSWL